MGLFDKKSSSTTTNITDQSVDSTDDRIAAGGAVTRSQQSISTGEGDIVYQDSTQALQLLGNVVGQLGAVAGSAVKTVGQVQAPQDSNRGLLIIGAALALIVALSRS